MSPQEILLNEYTLVSVHEIAASSGLRPEEIEELAELGVFVPRGPEQFTARCIELARLAQRLKTAFDLPLAAVALVLNCRERVRELERELHRLECERPGRTYD